MAYDPQWRRYWRKPIAGAGGRYDGRGAYPGARGRRPLYRRGLPTRPMFAGRMRGVPRRFWRARPLISRSAMEVAPELKQFDVNPVAFSITNAISTNLITPTNFNSANQYQAAGSRAQCLSIQIRVQLNADFATATQDQVTMRFALVMGTNDVSTAPAVGEIYDQGTLQAWRETSNVNDWKVLRDKIILWDTNSNNQTQNLVFDWVLPVNEKLLSDKQTQQPTFGRIYFTTISDTASGDFPCLCTFWSRCRFVDA